ncbi:hypothetical protein BASA81_011436 [Batrachochytrium salamandrivorans]|nr:hypothetical protein BASA81_011436 [Batrachochytrium salamandrivorans]
MSEAPMQEVPATDTVRIHLPSYLLPFAALVSADAAPSSDKPISVAQDDASVSESISAATTTHVEPSAPVEDAEMILTPSSTLTEKRKRGTQESPAQKKLVLEADTGEAEAKYKPAIPISSTHSLSTALLKTEEPSFGSFSAHESVGLTFGSAVSTSTSFASILAGSSSASSSAKLGSDTFARAGNSELKVDEEDHGSFTENAGHTFAEPMIVVTGEEDETTLHTARCKLYAWDGENWRERGAGSIKINESSGSKDSTLQRRLVMRADGVLRVILNVRILPSMPCHLRDDKYVEAVACEHPPTLTKFLFKFANNEVAASFLSSVEESLQSL